MGFGAGLFHDGNGAFQKDVVIVAAQSVAPL